MTAPLEYNQANGETYLDNVFEGIGYSGFDEGKNNPALEAEPNIGPCPKGLYTVTFCDPAEHPNLAAPVFRLTPYGHNAHNRTGLLIHGDNLTHTASHGCIILGHSIRVSIGAVLTNGNRPMLEVV
jgi:hypothetical protein